MLVRVGVEPSLLTSWTLDPLQLAPIVVVALAYGVRARTLARRGQPVPSWRIALFATGLAILVLALASPLATVGEEELFAAHMAQHVLLGDLAPLFLLAGLTGPLLRPVLAIRAVERLRVLANPLVALPLWTANLVLWHLPPLYEGAVNNGLLHALEHASFFAAGLVVWLPVLETLPAPEWFGTGAKLGYVVAVRFVEHDRRQRLPLGRQPVLRRLRARRRAVGHRPAGRIRALAGAVMMAEGGLVTLAALAWLFLRMAQEGEVRQELLERGLDPRTVRRAVRYGRWRELQG